VFLERAAACLIERRLTHGSPTVHNAEERAAERGWRAPCFPRFYFYDVLRGLAALVRWAERAEQAIAWPAIAGAVDQLIGDAPDGVIRIRRDGLARAQATFDLTAEGWRRGPISRFALLDAASAIGRPSAALTRQWAATRRRLLALIAAGRIVAW
jgi:hypothetical protein